MFSARVIPVLMLENRKLVKTIRFKHRRYIGDPVNAVRIFGDKGVDELIILDISQGRLRPDFEFVEAVVANCLSPITYGGGIRSVKDARRIFSFGVEKIAINRLLRERSNVVRDLVEEFGSQSVVASIDVATRRYGGSVVHHYDRRWQAIGRRMSAHDLVDWALTVGVGEIFINCVERDGTFLGYDTSFAGAVAARVSVPVTLCGGCSSLEEISTLKRSSVFSGLAAGSVFVLAAPGEKGERGVLIRYDESL